MYNLMYPCTKAEESGCQMKTKAQAKEMMCSRFQMTM